MNCYKCGTKIRDGYRFCSKCGAHQDIARNKNLQACRKCGEKIPDDDRFCGYCGFKQDNLEIVHGERDHIEDKIGSNNINNVKVRKLSEEEKIRLQMTRDRMKRRQYYPQQRSSSGYPRNDRSNLVQIGGALVVLVIVVSLGVYFLGDMFWTDDLEAFTPKVIEDVNNDTLENDDLQTNGDTQAITEEEVVRKLIFDFNDAWIGYVNRDESTVFQYIVPGSEVETNILNFDKRGVTEEFLEIQVNGVEIIGNQAFLKVHEKIEKTTNGKLELKVYDWIYEVEKNNDRWLIKNYTKDNNSSGQL